MRVSMALTAPTTLELVPRIDFGTPSDSHLGKYQSAPERHLYYYLLHADEHPDALRVAFEIIRARLSEADQSDFNSPSMQSRFEHDNLERLLHEVRNWCIEQNEQLSRSLGKVSRKKHIQLLREYAPTALLDGCWLQNFSSAATSHTGLAAGMLKLYSDEIGDGDPARHHGNAFRDLMCSLGIYLAEVGSFEFVEQPEVTDSAFSDPVFLLSISQFPRSFTPEILGLSLFHYACGICPLHRALLEQFGGAARFLDMHAIEKFEHGPAETTARVINDYIKRAAASIGGVDLLWVRVRRGFAAAYRASTAAIDNGVLVIQSPEKSPHEKMMEMIARKAHHAHGYHAGSMMGGRTLDDWLNPDHLDPAQFLKAFARSPYISPGDARGSIFFRELVAFRGPMFRIFSADELLVFAEWIDNLKQSDELGDSPDLTTLSDQPRHDHGPVGERINGNASRSPSSGKDLDHELESIKRYSQKTLGDLYYYLLNIEFYPDVRPFAKDFATRWLCEAGRALRTGKLPLPFEPYTHQDLDAWLEAQHTRQVESYQRQINEMPQSREHLIESTIQLAPMILIDGAWIQNASNAATSHTLVASRLFHIYFDEVGNGDVELNHPNIFRQLLTQMGVVLPEFGTLEFGRWPRFRPEAFRVPVFWLCVSQFPKRFLPETLGLNLAMELSGVGGAYRSAIDALRYHGYDPCFVELHNSIDNVATGHTAWAIEAIKCHMDEILTRGGAEAVEERWRRVWTGYRALAPA